MLSFFVGLRGKWRFLTGWLLLAACSFALILEGCGSGAARQDFSTQEKIAFVSRSDNTNNASNTVMIGTALGGDAAPLIKWSGKGGRYYFSNDGKFFSTVMVRKNGAPCTLVTTTDGSDGWYASYGTAGYNFSPDSTKLAALTTTTASPNNSTISVFDVRGGSSRALVEGKDISNPTWVNDKTMLYNEGSNHLLYSLDVVTGEKKLLSPADTGYTLYPVTTNGAGDKVAVIKSGPPTSIWSLDLADNSLRQITNNDRNPVQSMFLPGTDRILFTEASAGDQFSAEICLLNDSGSDFSMLTRDFDFDGNFQVSLSSGRIAYQHIQLSDTASWMFRPGGIRVAVPHESKPSIWVINADGSDNNLVASAGSGFLEGPGFAPVATWKKANPLEAELSGGSKYGSPVKIRITNPSDAPVEAAVRAFPGASLQLTSTSAPQPDIANRNNSGETTNTGLAARGLEWKISLAPGKAQEITMTPASKPQAGSIQDGSLLITVNVTDTQPLMFWQDLG